MTVTFPCSFSPLPSPCGCRQRCCHRFSESHQDLVKRFSHIRDMSVIASATMITSVSIRPPSARTSSSLYSVLLSGRMVLFTYGEPLRSLSSRRPPWPAGEVPQHRLDEHGDRPLLTPAYSIFFHYEFLPFVFLFHSIALEGYPAFQDCKVQKNRPMNHFQ